MIDPEAVSLQLLGLLGTPGEEADTTHPAEGSAEMHAPGGMICGTCQLAISIGERVIVFLDGDLSEGGGVTDLRRREAHHYECFFPEETT